MTYMNTIKTQTLQTQPILGREAEMVKMESGGHAFVADRWTRAERFLILGNERGSYYAKQQAMTEANTKAVLECLKENGPRLVNLIVNISEAGRAAKNEPAIYALALCASKGDTHTKAAALSLLSRVCRTGYHLFTFVAYVTQMRGWGRGLRRAVSRWYLDQPVERLAYQLVKYQSRTVGGQTWSHRDVLRSAHPATTSILGPVGDTVSLGAGRDGIERAVALRWATHGVAAADGKERADAKVIADLLPEYLDDPALAPIKGIEAARKATDEAEIVRLISEYRLTHEMLPTQFLKSKMVWTQLLDGMPMTAMLRNLGRLTANETLGTFGSPISAANVQVVRARLRDAKRIRKARLHPASILGAAYAYGAGKGERGSTTWTPISAIRDALWDAFEASFVNVPSSSERVLLGVDASGSMLGSRLAGFGQVSCADAAAAMAYISARTTSNTLIVPFTTNVKRPLDTRVLTLDAVRAQIDRIRVPEGTDVACPIKWALDARLSFDAFVLYTDMQSWAGEQHVVEALAHYRRALVPNAKLVTVSMVANNYELADISDPRSMSVVGFDTVAPKLIAEFVNGRSVATVSQDDDDAEGAQ